MLEKSLFPVSLHIRTWLHLLILYIGMSQVRPKMDYYYHIWVGATHPSFASLDILQKCIRDLLSDFPLSFSLLFRYFSGKYFNELRSLVSPILTFLIKSRHAAYIEARPHSAFSHSFSQD